MYIAMNRFKIILGKEDIFEEIWRGRDTHLENVKGFKKFNLIKSSEKEILKILYQFQCKNTNMALNYIRDLVDSIYIKKTFDSAKLISESFLAENIFFQNPIFYLCTNNDTNVINYDFVNKKYVNIGVS